MTIDEAIYCMTSYLPDERVDHCTNCKYYETDLCKSSEAHLLAITALKQMKEKE